MDVLVYGALKKYIDETLVGGGALKGKNCTIPSIETITGGHRVNFQWTLDDGTVETGYIDVLDGVNGRDGVDGTTCQWETLPDADQQHVGMIAQYIGATDTYTNGYFYKCVENDGVYSWENVNVQSGNTVTVTPITSTGTKIAEIEVDGVTNELYAPTDGWTATAQVDSNSTVTFTGLDDSLAYALYVEDKLATISSVTKTGSGTSVTLAYVLSGVSSGDVCKLRIVR